LDLALDVTRSVAASIYNYIMLKPTAKLVQSSLIQGPRLIKLFSATVVKNYNTSMAVCGR